MTERILTEHVTEYPNLRMRESDVIRLADKRAHSVGYSICLVFFSILTITMILAWVKEVRIYGNVTFFFIIYWVAFIGVATYISYAVSFHMARVAEMDKQTEWANAPTREVSKEYIDGQTAVLDYAETNPAPADVIPGHIHGKKTATNRYEEPVKIGGETLSGRMMLILRVDARQNNFRFNRDDVWVKLEGEIAGGSKEFKAHYSQWNALLTGRGYVTKGKNKAYTNRGIEEFLKFNPPTPDTSTENI